MTARKIVAAAFAFAAALVIAPLLPFASAVWAWNEVDDE